MKSNRFSEEKMVTSLREADRMPVSQVAKAHGISDQTIYNWRQRFGGMAVSDVRRLKLLEKENSRLKKLLAEKELFIAILKELNEKRGRRALSEAGCDYCRQYGIVTAQRMRYGPTILSTMPAPMAKASSV